MSEPIRTRRVYLLTGYEPLEPAAHHHRFDREIKRFEKTWSVRASVGPMTVHADRPVASWAVAVEGPDWRTTTDVRLLRWDDVIAEDVARPMWQRLVLYGRATADLFFTGTFFRYVGAYWRYSLFAGYPAVLLLAFTALSLSFAGLWKQLGGPYPAIAMPVLAIGLFLTLMRVPGRRFHMDYMLNDWIFARDMIRRTRPSIERRAADFAREIASGVKAGDVDEVVIIAHSLGAAWMVESVALALANEPDFAKGKVPLGLAGVGSSTLKIALHPAAGWIRDAVKRVADAAEITWAEYDSHVDFICFYKRNTVDALKLDTATRPVSHSIRLSRMLSAETWGRFRGNLLRVHRQYVMGNEQRYRYDFHMIACGPFRFAHIVHDGEALPDALGPDGSLGRAARPVTAATMKTAAP
ncbi:hypothetical protein [Phreatobacter stygius]|uniref:Alpha/beta hydrolase n=1 Tax=Phreatobacter stygius TaxID=1940610 RepID=A0A4D7AVF6_9HYPH|nr:hypothetical protein [Phreatobacter stygius]QCI63555.1 hypothetical protein E8M01_04470 [Phreatobacter stygius]